MDGVHGRGVDRVGSTRVEQLRLAAALAHSAPDVELVLAGGGRQWVVGYGRVDANLDPCAFRRLVAALAQGASLAVPPLERLSIHGGLVDLGGGVYERPGSEGAERRLATTLAAAEVEALLRAVPAEVADGIEAALTADVELGTTVVTLRSPSPGSCLHLDAIAHAVAASCMVAELLDAAAPGASP